MDVSDSFKIGYTRSIAGTLYDNEDITYLTEDDNYIEINPCDDIELVSFNYGTSTEYLEFYISDGTDNDGNPTEDSNTRSN